MSSTGPETSSPDSSALPSLQCTPLTGTSTGNTTNQFPADVQNNSPATGSDSQIDPTEAPTAIAENNSYTTEQLLVIESIEEEASSMFYVGATYQSSTELRDLVRKFAHEKGFSITTSGTRFSCSRCAEAPSYKARRLKKQQQTPPEKRRKRNTTRVGCSFRISFTHFNRNEKKAGQPIRINASTCYRHTNGCFPSSSQLTIEKRKAGAVAAAVAADESVLKQILTVDDSQIDPASNVLTADVVTEIPTVAVLNNPYTPEQLAVIESIAEEASSMFYIGATYQSSIELRDLVRKFAHEKGFSVTTSGTRFSCSRCAEAPCYRTKRLKKQQQIAPEKRRKRNTTRVGCSFRISFTHFNRNEKKADQPIRINASTCYRHTNGCFPSSSQLSIEKRKAGAVAAAVAADESVLKQILTVMATEKTIPADMLRRLVRPLYPPDTSLDSKFLCNIRLKIKRMLAKGDIDLATSNTGTDDIHSDNGSTS
ncbi:hypothetical protein IV203_027141 [Nitzschia inconspicua]|uniref:Uncharacterized protein n=1 Tax=Nitzschia inconspicua TaxID=303405 RepID=A0A9K3LL36_9STRA|nr:hypothetical protein IV203_027141 [Nitzschia inconspicua]